MTIDYKEKLFMREIAAIEGLEQGSEKVTILFNDGSYIAQYHIADCCEHVQVEQVDGNIEKHIGATAIDFMEKSKIATYEEVEESGTWTFYTLVTSKGYLDWRWLGESNGYYSESVESEFHENKGKQ